MDIPSPINWKIAGQPLNWLIVLSVLLVAGFVIDLTVRFMKNHPAFSQGTS
jgi:hypothetical protein